MINNVDFMNSFMQNYNQDWELIEMNSYIYRIINTLSAARSKYSAQYSYARISSIFYKHNHEISEKLGLTMLDAEECLIVNTCVSDDY